MIRHVVEKLDSRVAHSPRIGREIRCRSGIIAQTRRQEKSATAQRRGDR
jgi:hypothetical protein